MKEIGGFLSKKAVNRPNQYMGTKAAAINLSWKWPCVVQARYIREVTGHSLIVIIGRANRPPERREESDAGRSAKA